VHGGARRTVGGGGGGPAVRQLRGGRHPFHLPDREDALRGDARLGDAPQTLLRVALVDEKGLGLAVGDDVADLGSGEVPVDRRVVPAGLQRGQVEHQPVGAVRHEAAEAVARLESQLSQTVHEAVGTGEQVTGTVFGAVRVHGGDPVRIRLRQPPETERAHRKSSPPKGSLPPK
jgi:hypothetical protein